MSHVKMYTTAVCPYCIRAKQILKARGVEQIDEIRVDADPAARAHMAAQAHHFIRQHQGASARMATAIAANITAATPA